MTETSTYSVDIEAQYNECRQWRDLLREAGYTVCFQYSDHPAPFDREWIVYDAQGVRVASFDIDGCGAGWYGPDKLWRDVIGKTVGVN